MTFSPDLAEHRYGYGRSPTVLPPQSVQDMLAGLAGTDEGQATFPLPPYRHLQEAFVLRRRFARYARDNPDTAKGQEALEKSQDVLRDLRQAHGAWFTQMQLRRIHGRQGFRERLVAFWADHFTALGRNAVFRAAPPLYIEAAIRPHVTGSFGDLLVAAVTHPLMLTYLDQAGSVGPASRAAQRAKTPRGLNENLAREVLELHTLGVAGPYTQRDVRELAELLTGLSVSRDQGFRFRPNIAEPGAETVLGRRYGPRIGLDPIHIALRDLARHPATAAHLAHKLAVHFVSDTPPEGLVAAIRAAYLDSDGDLMRCYRALLEHPAAWRDPRTNMRPPDEFVSAALRSLAVPQDRLTALGRKQLRGMFFGPLRLMGQPWLSPSGPDGFDEKDSAWVTPQGVSARLEWAMNVPARLLPALPDPRVFLSDALGSGVPDTLRFAAGAAENRAVAIGLILSSPAFQRR